MRAPKFVALLAFVLSAVPSHAAIVSLYLPILGDSGVAITADNVGTDSAGHTTWSVGPASSASGSFSTPDFDFAPFTLVEGSTDVHVIQAIPTNSPAGPYLIKQDCGISNGIAVCTRIDSASGTVFSTQTLTQTVSRDPIEVATAAPTTGTNGAVVKLGGAQVIMAALGALGATSVLGLQVV